METTPVSRRRILQAGIAACLAAVSSRTAGAAADPAAAPLIRKAIPSTGEQLPVIGLGTNNYNVTTPEDYAPRREVLRRMPDLGGSVVDTAPAYGRSEIVLGELLSELGNRERFFLASKVTGDAVRAERCSRNPSHDCARRGST